MYMSTKDSSIEMPQPRLFTDRSLSGTTTWCFKICIRSQLAWRSADFRPYCFSTSLFSVSVFTYRFIDWFTIFSFQIWLVLYSHFVEISNYMSLSLSVCVRVFHPFSFLIGCNSFHITIGWKRNTCLCSFQNVLRLCSIACTFHRINLLIEWI